MEASCLCRLLPADNEHACGVEKQMPTEADNARSVTAELMAGLRRKAKPSTIDPVPGAAQAKKEVCLGLCCHMCCHMCVRVSVACVCQLFARRACLRGREGQWE